MRRLFAVTPRLLLAACPSTPDAQISKASTLDGSDAMRAKVAGEFSFLDCNSATRDVDGVLNVQCVDPTGRHVRMSTFGAGYSDMESLKETQWKVDSGETWTVGVSSDQATLDGAMDPLRS